MQVSKVLVVDGDRAARDALVTCLKFVGVDAHGAENTASAQDWLTTDVADVLVLSDEFTDGLPTDTRASVLVLTRAHAATGMPGHSRIDDTLRRPIALSRVVERVESMIQDRVSRNGAVLRYGDLKLDTANAWVSFGDEGVALGHFENRLLAFFMRAPDKVFTRAQLRQRIWSSSVRVEERTVDVHIGRLRLSLARVGCAGYVQTVRASGYRFSSF
jgi:two-component system phosphate regulon response regulator PhoB